MASPWRVASRTRTQRRERRPLGQRERVSPPSAVPTRVQAQLRPLGPPPPMAPASAPPRRPSPPRARPSPCRSPLRARVPQRRLHVHVTRPSGRREVPAPAPPPRRRRRARTGADHAANAVALLCATLRASNPRGARGATVRSPDARRCGISPPARPCPAAVTLRRIPSNTLSCPRNCRRPLYTGDYTRESPQPIRSDPVRPATHLPATRLPTWNPAAPAALGSHAAGQ
jgi:hypothetical protein